MRLFLFVLMSLASSTMPAWGQTRSRAFQAIEAPVAHQTSSIVRNPEDGDDLTPEHPAPRQRLAVSDGALGRTMDNSMGILRGTILIRTSERRLYLGLDKEHVRVYPVAVGKSGAQWRGEAFIGRKAVNPTWYPTKRTQRRKNVRPVVRPGPHNPLGVRALYLWRNGRETLYRIHGTNAPRSIGRSVSSGCIRMRNADVVDLYRRVSVGTRVTVR